MALMTWNDSFSVGVRVLDDQHKRLVNTLNDLHAAMIAGRERAVSGPLLRTLVEYTHEHFAAEEELMMRTKYPRLAAHRVKHKDLTQKVMQFVQRYERGELALNVELLMFLRDWLTTHIQKEDRDYGPRMNQNGIR